MRKLLGIILLLTLLSAGLLAQTGGVSTVIRNGVALPSGAPYDSLFILNGNGLYKCNVSPTCSTTANWTKLAEVDSTGKLSVSILYNPDTMIDVKAYGAVGDCVTDDHNAILAALTAAYNSTPIRAVFFSRPPGGCYLTSTLPWLGVSLIGVPNGIGNQVQQRISEIRGKPGQDIFNFGDPNTVASSTPHIGYVVRDTDFEN